MKKFKNVAIGSMFKRNKYEAWSIKINPFKSNKMVYMVNKDRMYVKDFPLFNAFRIRPVEEMRFYSNTHLFLTVKDMANVIVKEAL